MELRKEKSRSDEALRAVRQRVLHVVSANPWLAGRLVTNDDHENVQIAHPHPAAVDDNTVDELLVLADGLEISSAMPYEELVDAVVASKARPC